MVHHVVLFKWKPETPVDQPEKVAALLRTLPASIGEIRSYACGSNLGTADGNWDFGVHAMFDSVEDWRIYAHDAEHMRIIVDEIRPWLADRSATQFED